MALYEVRKIAERDKRGIERERYELFADGAYVTGLDIPKLPDHDWYRIAAKRLRVNLVTRHGDDAPEFGASGDDQAALTFAGMLQYA